MKNWKIFNTKDWLYFDRTYFKIDENCYKVVWKFKHYTLARKI